MGVIIDGYLDSADQPLEVDDVFARRRSIVDLGGHRALSRSTEHVTHRQVRKARTRSATGKDGRSRMTRRVGGARRLEARGV